MFILLLKLIKLNPLKERAIVILKILFNIKSIEIFQHHSCNWRFGLIVIFYYLYFMIIKSILINNIKTTKIILNTSEILEETSDVLSSSKMICWLDDENEISMSRVAPKETFLSKAFHKKMYNYITEDDSLCIFKKEPKMSMLRVMNKVVFLLSELLLSGTFAVISNFQPNEIYWMSNKPIFEMITVFYYRKRAQELLDDYDFM